MKPKKSFDVRDLAGLDPAIRLRIENTVLDMFAEQEFHRVNLGELASQARTSLQTIYKYYGSKEALVFATLDRELGELARRMTSHLNEPETANYKERLRTVYRAALEHFERKPKVARMIHTSLYGNTWTQDDTFRQPELMSAFLRVLSEGRTQGVLTDEVDARMLLDFFMGVLCRLVHMYLTRGMKRPPTEDADASFELLWRAIAKPQEVPEPA